MYTKVICSKCNGESVIKIDEQNKLIDWKKIGSVISGRYRLDTQWGWQCYCGNNTIMSDQERKSIADYRQPTIKEVNDITKNLVIVPDTSFRMEQI
jgi:hypothetical protein